MSGEDVATTLTIDADTSGAVDFVRAMAAAQIASQQAMLANDNYARSLRSANDNARDAADADSRTTIGLKSVAQGALDAAESMAKKAAAMTVAVSVAGALFRVLWPIYLAYKVLKEAIDLTTEAWDLGAKKLADYVAVAEKAEALDLSTNYFQRISRAAADAKMPVDQLTAAFTKLQDATTPKLGGNDAQNRLQDLIKAGNFSGNSGVEQLAQANTTEEKFRAITNLIDQAINKGERLAALDVAKTFLGDQVAANLQKDSEYLTNIQAAADKVASTQIVSDADIGNALELQRRYEAAVAILEQRWHPIQDILTAGGITMREIWVSIVEQIAAAFDWISKLVEKVSSLPNDLLNKFVDLTTTPESRAASAAAQGITTDLKNDPDTQRDIATRSLSARLYNPSAVAQAQQQALSVVDGVRKDQSRDPNAKAVVAPDTSAFDRAEESLLKYIQTSQAAATSVDLNAAAQERLKAIAQLTAAGMKDGLSEAAAKAKAEMSGLADKAAAAADALARAQINSQISFDRKAAFLSSEDVTIATQLKGIYGNDIPAALASSEAAAMRANNALKDAGTIAHAAFDSMTPAIRDALNGTNSLASSFQNLGLVAVKALEDMIIKLTIIKPLETAVTGAFGGASSGLLSALGIKTFHTGGVVGMDGGPERYVHPSYFDSAPRFHGGGIAGDEVPIIAQRGESVFTPAQMAAMGGGGGQTVNVNYAPVIDNRGSDTAAVARLASVLAQDKRDFEKNVTGIMTRYRANNPGANR